MTRPLIGTPLVRAVPVAILAASCGALIAAFAGEHVFGLEPCVLCLLQRVPYGVTAALAGVALMLPVEGHARIWIVAGCSAVFFAGAALAFYHVGVQQHWWGAITACGGPSVTEMSLEDLQAGLMRGQPKACDEVDWRLFGLSLAGFNTIASAVLGAATIAAVRMMRRGA